MLGAGTLGRPRGRVGYRHHQGRRHALAADIADAEKQFLVADEVIIQVTAHLQCRHLLAADDDIRSGDAD